MFQGTGRMFTRTRTEWFFCMFLNTTLLFNHVCISLCSNLYIVFTGKDVVKYHMYLAMFQHVYCLHWQRCCPIPYVSSNVSTCILSSLAKMLSNTRCFSQCSNMYIVCICNVLQSCLYLTLFHYVHCLCIWRLYHNHGT